MADRMSEDRSVTVLTCRGDVSDPSFPRRLQKIVCKLHRLVNRGKRKDEFQVMKVEPWNSVRVTFNIPREAAERIQRLAESGHRSLRDLGILSVQVDGDQVITLTLGNSLSAATLDLGSITQATNETIAGSTSSPPLRCNTTEVSSPPSAPCVTHRVPDLSPLPSSSVCTNERTFHPPPIVTASRSVSSSVSPSRSPTVPFAPDPGPTSDQRPLVAGNVTPATVESQLLSALSVHLSNKTTSNSANVQPPQDPSTPTRFNEPVTPTIMSPNLSSGVTRKLSEVSFPFASMQLAMSHQQQHQQQTPSRPQPQFPSLEYQEEAERRDMSTLRGVSLPGHSPGSLANRSPVEKSSLSVAKSASNVAAPVPPPSLTSPLLVNLLQNSESSSQPSPNPARNSTWKDQNRQVANPDNSGHTPNKVHKSDLMPPNDTRPSTSRSQGPSPSPLQPPIPPITVTSMPLPPTQLVVTTANGSLEHEYNCENEMQVDTSPLQLPLREVKMEEINSKSNCHQNSELQLGAILSSVSESNHIESVNNDRLSIEVVTLINNSNNNNCVSSPPQAAVNGKHDESEDEDDDEDILDEAMDEDIAIEIPDDVSDIPQLEPVDITMADDEDCSSNELVCNTTVNCVFEDAVSLGSLDGRQVHSVASGDHNYICVKTESGLDNNSRPFASSLPASEDHGDSDQSPHSDVLESRPNLKCSEHSLIKCKEEVRSPSAEDSLHGHNSLNNDSSSSMASVTNSILKHGMTDNSGSSNNSSSQGMTDFHPHHMTQGHQLHDTVAGVTNNCKKLKNNSDALGLIDSAMDTKNKNIMNHGNKVKSRSINNSTSPFDASQTSHRPHDSNRKVNSSKMKVTGDSLATDLFLVSSVTTPLESEAQTSSLTVTSTDSSSYFEACSNLNDTNHTTTISQAAVSILKKKKSKAGNGNSSSVNVTQPENSSGIKQRRRVKGDGNR